MRKLLVLVPATLLLALPTAALAHSGHGETVGLLHGFLHPLGGLDHVLAMLAVGVFAYVLGGKALWLVPLSFVMMMGAGFLLGVGQIGLPFVELAIGLSSVAIGGAAALGRPMPVAAASALVGVFALFHGQVHGAEMPVGAAGFEFALGFIAATAVLHVSGIGAALGVSRLVGRHGRRLAQAAGGLFALGGVGLLAGWL